MAIKITPTRTGANVELKDIATILSEQNQVLAINAEATDKLSKSFASFIEMLKGQDAADERAERQEEAREKNQASTARGSKFGMAKEKLAGITGGFEGFVAGVIPFALGLLKRFIPALLTVGLADQVANAIEGKIGPELANVVESALTGAGIGFLLGGAKGGIYGAILMALFSDASRDAIVGMVNNIFKTDFANTGPESFAVVGGAALAAKFMIGLLPKLLPLLLSPTGFLALAIAGGLAGYFVYNSLTPEQQAAVDKVTAPYRTLMADISINILEKMSKTSEDIVDSIKAYLNTSLNSMGFGSKFLTRNMKEELLSDLSADDRKKFNNLEKEAMKNSRDFMTAFAGTGEEKDALRKEYGLEGTTQNELYGYFEQRSLELGNQMDAIVEAKQKEKEAAAKIAQENRDLIEEFVKITKVLEESKGKSFYVNTDLTDFGGGILPESVSGFRDRKKQEAANILATLRARGAGPFATGSSSGKLSFSEDGTPYVVSSGEYYSGLNDSAAQAIKRANAPRPPTGNVDASTTMVDNSVNTTTAAMVEGGSAMDTGDVYADRMKRMMN